MQQNSNIFIFSEPVQSGKSTTLMKWVKTRNDAAGIIAPDLNGERKLVDIQTKNYFDFELKNIDDESKIITVGKFQFLISGFEKAQEILLNAELTNPEWLIVDEIGTLELHMHSGLEPAVSKLIRHYKINQSKKLLLVVRDSLLEECIEHFQLQNANIIHKDFFKEEHNELFGLVLCGGNSSRMGMDKCFITYHDKPQLYHLYEMMQPLCKKVFISCNESQVSKIDSQYELIVDDPEFKNIGPMAGLLSAFKKIPDKSFLVVGCDYPFVKREDLVELSKARDKKISAVCYVNESSINEPLLAIYESAIFPLLKEMFEVKNYSLKAALNKINAKQIAGSKQLTQSIDNVELLSNAIEKMKSSQS